MPDHRFAPGLTDIAPGLEDALGLDTAAVSWESEVLAGLRSKVPWHSIGFLSFWEIQSQLSAIVLIALLAFVSPLLALGPMLVWSLLATVVYYQARERGVPDVLEAVSITVPRSANDLFACARTVGVIAGRVWLAGFQSFVYARVVCPLLARTSTGPRRRLVRIAVVAVGLTLFGVSTSQHVLRKAGFRGAQLLRFGFLGSVLNVGYRVLLSALLLDVARIVASAAID